MKGSFQFMDPKLLKIEFHLNDGFEPNQDESIRIDVKTETEISKGDDLYSAFVVLRIVIGSEDSSVPFYVCAEEGAEFKWEGDSVYGINPDKLLNSNAPSLLLSYLRPTIAMVTAASPYSAYNIPFMNFAGTVESEQHEEKQGS